MNPFDLMKNFSKIQEQLGSIQDTLGSIRVTGSSGGGMVEIEITGKMEVLAVRIKPEAADPSDITVLEDLVAAALAQALEKMREKFGSEIGSLAGGLGISLPGLFGQT
jgi:DNA-binding YbaB/EbfC family protein